jgi:hypothetical protein
MTPAGSFMKALSAENLLPVAQDLAEVALDSALSEGVLREIPLLSTVLGIGRAAVAARDQVFASKVSRFVATVGKLSRSERARMVDELAGTDSLKERVGLAILDLLEKSDPIEKPKLIGNLFVAMGQGKIPGRDILRLSSMITGAFVEDLELLAASHEATQIEHGRRFALQANGFLISEVGELYAGGGTRLEWRISKDGRTILDHCF